MPPKCSIAISAVRLVTARRVTVRIVAATNRRLSDDVSRGRFREDLFYRLAVVPVALPPLRERIDDLAALSAHLLGRIAGQLGLVALTLDEAVAALATDVERAAFRIGAAAFARSGA